MSLFGMEWIQRPYPNEADINMNLALGRQQFKIFEKMSPAQEIEMVFFDWSSELVTPFLFLLLF